MAETSGLAGRMWTAAAKLRKEVDALEFGAPVTHVYDPLAYAAKPHRAYLERFGSTPKRVVFLGMNPGPFGMAQTGVPFGEVSLARDWMGLEAPVDRPDHEHPRRPIQGFECTRSEVSGRRVWQAVADHFGKPEAFFENHFLSNYCPLLFMEASGRNRTPDKLPAHEREPLFAACDRHLRRVVTLLEPAWVVGIGGFARKRAEQALADRDLQIGTILHPSPANPRANRGWEPEVRRQLEALGICRKRRGVR